MTPQDYKVLLHGFASRLASVCDGARSEDSHGFNGGDADFGHSIASRPPQYWTEKITRCAHRMLGKYAKTQLGVDWSTIPTPDQVFVAAAEASPAVAKSIDEVLAGLKFSEARRVETRNGPRMVSNAAPTEDFWQAWRTQGAQIKSMGYSVGRGRSGAWEVSLWKVAPDQAPAAVGCTPVPPPAIVDVPQVVLEKLFDFQHPSVRTLVAALQKHNRAFDGSDLGSGKTYVALAAAKTLGLYPFIVCPKAVMVSWQRAADHVGIRLQGVINYDLVRRGETQWGKWIEEVTTLKNGKTIKKEVFRWNLAPNTLLCFDECHRMKNYDTQNTAIGVGALAQGIKCLGISGTVGDKPQDFRWSGELVGLHNGRDFYRWMIHNGCSKSRWGGLEWNGNREVLARINRHIFPEHGTRIRISEIPGYPECQTQADVFDCNGGGAKIQAVYDELAKELKDLQKREDLSPGARQGHVLALQNFARQKAEILKVPAIVDMATDYIEQGKSVVIFTNFKATLEALCEKLETKCIVEGGQSAEERQANIDAFQADKSRIIIVNIQSGGAGLSLHDLNGTFPRVSIICPTWSAQDLKQATGRIHRAGAKSKALQVIFYAANTIEEDICQKVRGKISRLDLVNDGDLAPAFTLFSFREKTCQLCSGSGEYPSMDPKNPHGMVTCECRRKP